MCSLVIFSLSVLRPKPFFAHSIKASNPTWAQFKSWVDKDAPPEVAMASSGWDATVMAKVKTKKSLNILSPFMSLFLFWCVEKATKKLLRSTKTYCCTTVLYSLFMLVIKATQAKDSISCRVKRKSWRAISYELHISVMIWIVRLLGTFYKSFNQILTFCFSNRINSQLCC